MMLNFGLFSHESCHVFLGYQNNNLNKGLVYLPDMIVYWVTNNNHIEIISPILYFNSNFILILSLVTPMMMQIRNTTLIVIYVLNLKLYRKMERIACLNHQRASKKCLTAFEWLESPPPLGILSCGFHFCCTTFTYFEHSTT